MSSFEDRKQTARENYRRSLRHQGEGRKDARELAEVGPLSERHEVVTRWEELTGERLDYGECSCPRCSPTEPK